ncbi:MAG: MBL fold metallo-hydrolase [Desulfobacula sp.]|nr:MBL fold metallo-hydrolase [Desulfobacula sp.]
MSTQNIELAALKGNSLRLDGGAMFGNAPKALWQRWIDVDENNLIPIGSRALLVKTSDVIVLFETGAGAYLSPELKKRFQVVESDHVLLSSLKAQGLGHEDITHVILSHLHFDHAGGLLKAWEKGNNQLELLFPNAQYVVGKQNFQRSAMPHFRDRASFIPGLTDMLKESHRLVQVVGGDSLDLGDIKIEFIESCGHTPGMMMSYIQTPYENILFAGDLAPGHAWVNLPITMGYDRFPEGLIDEKQQVFQRVYKDDAWIFYTHDYLYAVSKLEFDKKKKRFQPIKLSADVGGIKTGQFH